MDIQISKKDLLRGVARTCAVADRKSSMPILANILVTAERSGALRFAATDLYLAISTTAEAKVKTAGTVAVSARTLRDIVNSLPEGEVTIKLDKQHVQLRAGKSKFRIPGMPGEDFPPLPSAGDAPFTELDSVTLRELIRLTNYSMSHDDTRPHLNGTLFEYDGKTARMVTTDGHRLSKAEANLAGDGAFSMLVPGKGISELKRLVEDAKPTIGVASVGGNAFFRGPDMVLSVKLADENFPPYSKVIPASHRRRAIVARELLHDCVRRMSLVASDKGNGVRLKLAPGVIEVESENPDVGEGSEEIDVDFAGTPLTMGVNAKYFLEALAASSDDEIALEFGGELDPLMVKPATRDGFVAVIMPMRV